MKISLAALFAAAVSVLVLTPHLTAACSCFPGPTKYTCGDDLVLHVKILSKINQDCSDKDFFDQGPNAIFYPAKVLTVLRNAISANVDVGKTIYLQTAGSSAACGLDNLTPGSEYVFTPSREPGSLGLHLEDNCLASGLSIALCSFSLSDITKQSPAFKKVKKACRKG